VAAQTQSEVNKYLQEFEKTTTVKVLPNGLTLIICERHEAPVFSYTTFIDAGDVNDPSGESGLAHMFEHLAFKGTTQIGTKDWPAEKVALQKVEAANNAYEAEYRNPNGANEAKLKQLQQEFLKAQAEAEKYVIPNQFSEVAEANGAHGLNAETGLDDTQYFWSMPENRLELWAWMESSRLADTVPREFYKERSVVMEERRMRVDSNPIGRLVEQFLATAYVAQNYGRSSIGWPSEVSQITATEAMAFHKKYYAVGNIVVAVVGDVDTKAALPLLEKYFGRVPAGPKPEDMTTVEPKQFAEKSVVIREQTQPFYIEATTGPTIAIPTTQSTTRSVTSCRMAGSRVSIAAWSSSSRSRPLPRASARSPAKSTQVSLPSMRFRSPATRRPRCVTPSTKKLRS
jgi:predicted Zn-dependent peptidase